LQKELADLSKLTAEMDRIRGEENHAFDKNHPEMEQGLKIESDFSKGLAEMISTEDKGHQAAEGAGSGIIGMLEVIESDFTKGITEMVAAEQMAADTYEKETSLPRLKS
jgi:hypothetical protein